MSKEPRVPPAVLRRTVFSAVVYFVVLFGLLFLPAGDIRWAKGWTFLLVFFVLMALAIVYLWRANPDIFIARS